MVNFLPQIYVQIWTTLELPPSSPVPVAAPWHCTHAGCPSAAAALGGPRVAPGWEQSCPCVPAGTAVRLRGSGGFSSAAAAEVMPGLLKSARTEWLFRNVLTKTELREFIHPTLCAVRLWAWCLQIESLATAGSEGAGSLPVQALGRRQSSARHSTVF